MSDNSAQPIKKSGFELTMRMRGLLLVVLVIFAGGIQVYQTYSSYRLNQEIAVSLNHIGVVTEITKGFDDLHEMVLEIALNREQVLFDSKINSEPPELIPYYNVLKEVDNLTSWFGNLTESVNRLTNTSLPLPDNYINVAPFNVSTRSGTFVTNKHYIPVEFYDLKDVLTNEFNLPSLIATLNSIDTAYSDITVQSEIYKNTNDAIFDSNGVQRNISGVISELQLSLNANSNDTYVREIYNRLSQLQSTLGLLYSNTARAYAKMISAPYDQIGALLGVYQLDLRLGKTNVQIDFDNLVSSNNGVNLTDSDFALVQKLAFSIFVDNDSLFELLQRGLNALITIGSDTSTIQHLVDKEIPNVISRVNNDIILISSTLESDLNQFKGNLSQVFLQRTTINIVSNILIMVLLLIALSLAIPFIRRVSGLTTRLDRGFTQMANKDLNIKQFEKYSTAEIGRIQQGFDMMVSELRGILQTLARSTEDLAQLAQSMAASSEEASASINQVSDTISTIALGASQQTNAMQRISQSLSEHLDEVQKVSERIQVTSEFVKKVAKRTNILGLNASIEAAKAGHFGGGFSVVAENVRELSDDTKASANEISELIEDVSYKITRTVQNVLREVNEMKEITENTAAGTEEANASSSEQVSMLSEISEQAAEVARISAELNEILSEFKF